MSRTNTACREYVSVSLTQLVENGRDDVMLVADDTRFGQHDSETSECPCQKLQVGILCLARENLVADDQDTGRDRFVHICCSQVIATCTG